MSAYLIAFVTAHNLDWVAEYRVQSPNYGGKYLAVAKSIPDAVKLVEGTASVPDGIVIFTFPSMAAIKNFIEAPVYAPYKKARVAATKSDFFAFENDDNAPQFLGH